MVTALRGYRMASRACGPVECRISATTLRGSSTIARWPDPMSLSIGVRQPRQHRQHHPVGPLKIGPVHLAAQHRHLMA
jgi:hypothetical protein